MNLFHGLLLIFLLASLPRLFAQTGGLRRIPPPGLTVPADERVALESALEQLGSDIASLMEKLKENPAQLARLPDVQLYHKAVDWALRYNEFYRTNEIRTAHALIGQGRERAAALASGTSPWATATGLVVRAYQSRIDGSIQPYGLVIPPSYSVNTAHRFRLDFWFHGRGEQLSELSFVNERQTRLGEFAPRDTIVAHLYGRYCNANRFAGEIDLFEAWEKIRNQYPIDENRVVVRGFSMGGAACWQFATHYPGLWAAAAPGAGFSETIGFLRLSSPLPDHERKLLHWYDSTDYAVNLFNCPTVAYSGEIDGQKQAADMMAKALKTEGIELAHIIGPDTPHRYHPQSKLEIDRRLDSIVSVGRNPVPEKIKFVTWTLRYNNSHWVTVDRLGRHWELARIDARIDRGANAVHATTTNITALTFSMPSGHCPLDPARKVSVNLDGQILETTAPGSDRSWVVSLIRDGNQWRIASEASTSSQPELVKRHGLQGPIDDAFLDSFIMVRPSRQPMNETVGAWVVREQARAVEHWRHQFRGDARVRLDSEITDADLANNHLVLWGDSESNEIIKRIMDKLPIRWTRENLRVGGVDYPADRHVPVLIYPNPLNPKRYIVLNSGFTFREFDYLNNARQTAKLPDYAVIDTTVAGGDRAPGGIAVAGFFDEMWRLPTQ